MHAIWLWSGFLFEQVISPVMTDFLLFAGPVDLLRYIQKRQKSPSQESAV
jgi:hypothetical protein